MKIQIDWISMAVGSVRSDDGCLAINTFTCRFLRPFDLTMHGQADETSRLLKRALPSPVPMVITPQRDTSCIKGSWDRP